MRYICLYIFCLLSLIGCSPSEEEQERLNQASVKKELQEDSLALKVAVMPTLDCLPLYVASDRGMFRAEGVDVRLRCFTSQMDQDTALQKCRVEGIVSDLVRTEYLKQQGLSLRYVTSTNQYWLLFTNRTARIKRLNQLEDKMVAMSRYSATAMLADYAVDSVRLNSEHVFRIQINDVFIRLNMLENSIMDALFLSEPQATSARLMKSPILLDSRQTDMRMGVLAFNEKLVADTMRQRQLDGFVKAYNIACDSINQYGYVGYADIIEKYCHTTRSVVDSLPRDHHYNRIEQPREKDIVKAQQWLRKELANKDRQYHGTN